MNDRTVGLVGAIGVAAGGALAGVAIAAVLGFASAPGLVRTGLVAVLVGVAAVLPSPVTDRWRSGAALGAAVSAVALVGLALMDGGEFGAGQIGGLVGALASVPLLALVWGRRPRFDAWFRFGLSALVTLAAVALALSIVGGGALGHDESAYAVKARSWITENPDTGWDLHRAPVLSVLGVPIVAVTEAEEPFRILGAVLAVGSLAAVGLVAHRMGGRWAALVAMAIVAASLSFLRRGSEFLTDVAAAGLLVLVSWLVLGIVAEPEARRRHVLWLAPLVAVAFYVRYQSALGAIAIAMGALAAWPARVKDLRRELGWAAGATFLLLLPHLIWATVVTGAPWGIVTFTQGRAGREFLGEGLVDYAGAFPYLLAGPAGALAMVFAVVGIAVALVRAIRRRRLDDDARLGLFVLVVVLIAVVPLGLVVHGEPRFVFFPVWLLVAGGATVAIRLLDRLPPWTMRVAVAVGIVAFLALFAEAAGRADRNAEARADSFSVVVDVSHHIAGAGPGDCGVLTTYLPQVTWYSGCWTAVFRPAAEDLGLERLQGDRRYVLLFENGKRQPAGEDLEPYLDLGPSTEIPARDDSIGDAVVIRVDRDP